MQENDDGGGATMQGIGRKSASLEMCPKDVKDRTLVRLDEIKERTTENLNTKEISESSNKAAQSHVGQADT